MCRPMRSQTSMYRMASAAALPLPRSSTWLSCESLHQTCRASVLCNDYINSLWEVLLVVEDMTGCLRRDGLL